jgi:hypothetical protein
MQNWRARGLEEGRRLARHWVKPNIYLWLVSIMVGIISTLVTQPAWAEAKLDNQVERGQTAEGRRQKTELINAGTGFIKERGDLGPTTPHQVPATAPPEGAKNSPTL